MVAAAARSAGPSHESADRWHVLMAPGETKVLTLEQLDDLFRLEIIDASTRVWQPGMPQWLPLSVVAGLEEDAEPAAPLPAPPALVRPAPPSRAPALPSPPTLVRPAPPSARPAAPAFAAPAVPLPWAAAVAASPISPSLPPPSLRPMVVSEAPRLAPPRNSRIGGVLMAFAVLGAAAITLYRNDVLRSVARSAGQETAYLQLERTLGSPGFGTPRAIEQLAATLPVDSLPVHAAAPLATQAPRAAAPAHEAEPTTPPAAPALGDRAATPSNEASLTTVVATQLRGSPSKLPKERPRARERETRRPEAAPSSRASNLGIKGSSHTDDPLNGKL